MTEPLPNFDLSGRTALVTGAARGLGRAISRALASAGADLILGVLNPSSAKELEDEIVSMGRKVQIVSMDVTNLDTCMFAIDKLAENGTFIDILVNNAGGGIGAMAIDAKPEDFDKVISHNVKSAYFISQRVAQHLIAANKSGDIINVSSQAALVALPGESVYCLSKAALSHMTRCMAVEWGKHGIRVNAICPTFFETPGTSAALSDSEFKKDTIERVAALKRLGQPHEVAGAVVFLASPAASMITGHNLAIDGGWTIR